MRELLDVSARPAESVPRRDELLAIDQALEDAVSGKRAMLAFLGSPGAGKTFLASRASARAKDLGLRVATASGHAFGNVPLLVALTIARQLEVVLPAEASAATVLNEVQRAVDALVLEGETLLLVFDDADAYHPTDLALLEQLLLRPPPGRLVVIVTARLHLAGRSASELLPLLERLNETSSLRLHMLAPLGEREVRSLFRRWFTDAVVSSRFIADALFLSGGNAGYLVTIGDALRSMPPKDRTEWLIGNRPIEVFPIPETLSRTIARQLAARDPVSRSLLQVVAVWADGVTVEEVARLVGLPADEAGARLAQLESARVLRCSDRDGSPCFEFADQLVRRVVYGGMPLVERQRLHDAVAAILERDGSVSGGGVPTRMAEHYRRGSRALDAGRTELLIDGAQQYVRTGRYAEAAALLEGARGKLEGASLHMPARGLAVLGEVYVRQGAITKAEEVLRQEDESGAPTDRGGQAMLMHRMIRVHIAGGDDDAALVLGEQVLGMLDSLVPPDRVALLGDLAALKHVSGHPDEARQLAERALVLAESSGDGESASAEALKLINFALRSGANRRAIDEGRRAYALARSAGSDRAAGRAALGIGLGRLQSGALRSAQRWERRGRRIAIAADDRPTEAFASFYLAHALLEGGEWELAAGFAEVAVELDAGLHRERALGPSRALRDRLGVGRGVARPALVHTSALRGNVPSLQFFVDEALALVDQQLEIESWETAEQMLGELDRALSATPGWEYPMYVEVLPRAARVVARRDDRARLAEIVGRMEAAPLRDDAPLAGIERLIARSRLERLDGLAAEAAAGFESAAERFGRLGFFYRRATVLAEAGAATAEAGDEDRGAAQLKEAFQQLERIGAARELDRVRAALHALHRRAPARVRERLEGALTPREREVAGLASGGETNAEIAVALGISKRTVTTHMHNLLRKLSLRSRHELKHEGSAISAPV